MSGSTSTPGEAEREQLAAHTGWLQLLCMILSLRPARVCDIGDLEMSFTRSRLPMEGQAKEID